MSNSALRSVGREHELTLPAHPAAVAALRHGLFAILVAWESLVDRDVAVLLVSEVGTNAVVYGARPCAPVRMVVREGPGWLSVQVHDPGDGQDEPTPSLQPLDGQAEGGRGLGLVEMLAADWGCKRDADGRFVYFVLDDAVPGAPCSAGATEHAVPGTGGPARAIGGAETTGLPAPLDLAGPTYLQRCPRATSRAQWPRRTVTAVGGAGR